MATLERRLANVGVMDAMNERKRRQRTAAVLTFVANMLLACFADAEPGPTSASKAAADALFAEGRALAAQGKHAEACEKFVESERFEPSAGTSLNLGECHERLGRTASAYGAFGDAKRLAALRQDPERENYAAGRRAALEPHLSKIALSIPKQVPGVQVFLDGQALGPGAIGAAIPVDPGKHLVRAIATDKPAFEKVLDVGKGPLTVAVEVVFPGDKPAADSWTPLRKAGVAIGVTGVVGLFVGGGFGIGAIVKNNASKENCLPENVGMCSEQGISLRNQAGTFADVSTGTLLAGVVLTGIGTGMLILGGSGEKSGNNGKQQPQAKEMRVVPLVGPGFGGVVMGMEF